MSACVAAPAPDCSVVHADAISHGKDTNAWKPLGKRSAPEAGDTNINIMDETRIAIAYNSRDRPVLDASATPDKAASEETRFMASSKRFASINKGLAIKLVHADNNINEANKRIATLEACIEKTRADQQLANTLASNATVAAKAKARSESDKLVALAIIKAKFDADRQLESLRKTQVENIDALNKKHKAEVEFMDRQQVLNLEAEYATYAADCMKTTIAVNELRFTEMFGINSQRGDLFCPVTQTPIFAMEEVVALLADCDCNCIVKRAAGQRFITNFADGIYMKCPKCMGHNVRDVIVTTAQQSERSFAWRAVQNLTGCSPESELIAKRLLQIETEAAQKTAQDTAPLRARLDGFKSATADLFN